MHERVHSCSLVRAILSRVADELFQSAQQSANAYSRVRLNKRAEQQIPRVVIRCEQLRIMVVELLSIPQHMLSGTID